MGCSCNQAVVLKLITCVFKVHQTFAECRMYFHDGSPTLSVEEMGEILITKQEDT